MKTIFTNPRLLVIGAAEAVSHTGSWITMMAVFAMLVFRGDGGVAQSSGVFLSGLLPVLLFSPAAGWLVDRFDRRWLMAGSEVLSAAVVAGLMFTQRLEWIYALLALQAAVNSVMSPARQACVPQLVAPEDLTRANAFFQQLTGLVKIGAPMLAGALLAVLEPQQAILLDVVSFLVSAFLLSRLPALLPEARASRPGGAPLPVQDGGTWALLKSSRGLQMLFLSSFLGIFIIVGLDVLAAVYVRDTLLGDEALMGLLIGLVGLGTLAAALLLMSRRAPANPWRGLVGGLALLAVIPASAALSGWVGSPAAGRLVAAAGFLAGGFGNGLINIQLATLLQTLTPPPQLGRVGGLLQSTAVAGQIGGALLTPLLTPGLISLQGFFAFSALAMLAVVVYDNISLRSELRRERMDYA